VKRISVQDLKAQLSAAIAEAASGETILIMRHSKPVALLAPVHMPHLHQGRLFGKARIDPAVRKGTNGRYRSACSGDQKKSCEAHPRRGFAT
jgi:antitoxin (DNA-binding transcriptional repressor) of toxin-antitoxin stability system